MYLVVPPGGSFVEVRRFEIGADPLTIGRAEACDVRIDMPGVDQAHVRISDMALVALGPDCAVGDVPLDAGSRRLLTPGDEIQIGSVVVVLEEDEPSPPRAPRVRVVEGASFGDELVLEENREYTVGRGAHCDLVVEDREVSREHIRIVRRGDQVFVQDLGSTRGSWLGRSSVYSGASVEWARPRMLRIGVTVLSLLVPREVRPASPMAGFTARMTPALRLGYTTSGPDVVFSNGSAEEPSFSQGPLPGGPHVFGLAGLSTLPRDAPNVEGLHALVAEPTKTAWKQDRSAGRAITILLVVGVGIAVVGGLFWIFSVLE